MLQRGFVYTQPRSAISQTVFVSTQKVCAILQRAFINTQRRSETLLRSSAMSRSVCDNLQNAVPTTTIP